ncbi:hypothetical protein JRI60_23150 [Archangium violaceum]|uniref:hypothetical protein n=1 Tax=Archangium violaceum TaxID=83451 RepID=UPI00195108C6|nr:hypothetical protein [Archangium violaceum]QRO01711.1 hypothetical protein JRI60_23150 [Archangium violaceum]
MSRTLLVAFVLLLSTVPGSVLAAEGSTWGTTFPADALATHLGDTPARYLLVPAGSDAPELSQAELALSSALRASGKALLVMNAQALGPVAQLDDASIVQRGAGFPVDRVMVLRLFPDASGALTQAVVTLYDTAGQSRGSFSAVAGTALAARTQAPQQQVAATPAPMAPVRPAPKAPAPPTVPNANPTEQYEQQYIGFDELIAVSSGTGAVVSTWTVPYVGKFKRPLEGDALYRLVGRNDLVQAYQDKMNTKTLVSVVGGAALLGGGILSISALAAKDEDCDVFSSDFNACFDRNRQRFKEKTTTSLVGMGISAVGIGVLAWGIVMSPHPITPSEARELADGYNKQLKANLGLSEEGTPVTPEPTPSTPASIQARLSPVLGPNGAGLLLSGRF